MGKRMTISAEQVAEIEAARKKNKDKNVDRRLQALLLYAQGEKRDGIAHITGYSKNHICDIAVAYRDQGLPALVENHYPGNHRNMSREEEALFLKGYEDRAAAGEMVTVKEIKLDYAEKVGRETRSNGQIYALLERHDWRKKMPRSKHPNKASDEEIEASKKLTIE
jgi:transposase